MEENQEKEKTDDEDKPKKQVKRVTPYATIQPSTPTTPSKETQPSYPPPQQAQPYPQPQTSSTPPYYQKAQANNQPPQQPPYYPPAQTPYMPSPYYTPYPPPPPQYSSVYTWEMYPHLARNLLSPKPNKKPIILLIGVLLLITAALEFPAAGMFIFYGTAEDLDFGGTMDIEGKIISENGSNMSGVRITILNTGLTTFSDSQGNYEIQNAPQGIWRIRTSLSGYKQETHKLLLQDSIGSDTDEDFILEYNFQMQEGVGEVEHNELWLFFSLAIIMMMFSLFILAGAFLAFKQKRFAVVLVGGILGMLTMTPPLLFPFMPSIFIMGVIGFLMSSSAMITTITNRKEFAEKTHVQEVEEKKEPVQNQNPQSEVPQRSPGSQE